MRIKKIAGFLFLLFSITLAAVFGQEEQNFPRGAIFDEEAYNSLPRRAELAAGSYEGLPKAYSLKQYAPLPGDQEELGTCVAWAVAYAARTISESVAMNRMNQTETTQNAFSPVYVYRTIRPDDPDCWKGTQIFTALDMMRDSGAVRMVAIERTVDFRRVNLTNYADSKTYPIAGYVTLFARDEEQKPALITRMIKKSLTEGKPVIVGMNIPDSFLEAKDIWEPWENPEYFYGGHAMCVVGYDDDRGAFELMNSWGRKWGNGGFMWIPYRTFADFVMESYEIIENLAVYSNTVRYDGFARLDVLDSAEFKPVPLAFSNGVYRTADTFSEGTEFRITVGARENAYVYAFAVSSAEDDVFFAPALLFPRAGISPLLNYRESEVIIPGEGRSFVLDANIGTEYFVILHSKQALNMQSLMQRFQSARGSLETRLSAAIGPLSVSSYNEKEASFTAEPDDPKAVAALIIAIEHR
jgi:hypothetical protein